MRRAALAAIALAVCGCGSRPATDHGALDYRRLPMSFERNAGQAPRDVRFLARGPGFALLLTDRAPVLALARTRGTLQRLRLGLAGTSSAMRLAAAGPRTGTVNYLVGHDRSRWRRGIPTYGAARYLRAYPGIDVAFHGTDRRLEFDFEVAPGADPGRIALAPSGQRSLRLDRGGSLVLGLTGGAVREAPPRTSQVIDGRVVAIPSRFVRRADGTIGVSLGRYDRHRAVTIDPVLTYDTYLGGSSFDLGYAIAVDGTGAAYVAGTTGSVDFPATAGAQQPTSAGNQDAFVTKIAPDGRSLTYSTYFGGSGIDVADAVAVDASGDAYVTGSTTSPDLPVTAGALQPANGGGTSDAFVTELAPSGAALTYSTYLGGGGSDQGASIAVGAGGSAVVAGTTGSSAFPTTTGAAQTSSAGGSSDAFVSALQPGGSALAWSTLLGGAARDDASGVALDASGAAYVTGRTQSASFPVTAGAFQGALRGSMDGFVTKVSATGDAFAWSTLLGGGGTDSAEAIALDGTGAVYVSGTTTSGDFPVSAGAAQAGYGGGANDAFAAKLAPDGGSVAAATLLGGNASDQAHGIGVEAGGEAFVTGQTASTNFPVSADAVQGSYPGGSTAAYLTRLAPSFGSRTFSTFLGGSGGAAALGLALDGTGAAYLTGSTSSPDLPGTTGEAQPAAGGSTDAFVAKLVAPPVAAPPTTTTTAPPPTSTATTTEPPPSEPKIVTGPVRVTWNRVSLRYRLIRGVAILFDVITPARREVSADLSSGVSRGTLRWNRRVAGGIAPPGHYHLTLTASGADGDRTVKHLGVTLRILYAHAPRIHDGAARIRYELTEPAAVTLAVARGDGPRTVVARAPGRRGRNAIAWDLLIGGRRAAGGAYHLFVTARTRRGATVRVAVPAAP